ncbi:MAG TPA: DUF6056 family protein, partial [Burkholderiales bacterium]|nr:DUF6056 family protein [Burkholderiales bacterium]
MAQAPAAGVTRELPAWIGGAGVAAAVVLASMIVALGWSNWPSADDFCNTVLVRNGGISGAMHWLYTQWSGRVFTGIVMYTTFALVDIPLLHVVSAVLAAMLVLAAWQMSRFANEHGRASAPLFAFALAVLVLGGYPLLGQTVYWPTGGIVYLVPLILLLHWLHGIRRLIDDEALARANPYWFVVSAALGNSIELVLPVALAYLAIVAFPRWPRLTRAGRAGLLARTAGLAVGIAVLVTAPGNFLRGDATPGSFELDPALLVHEYGRLLATTLRSGALVVAIAAAMAVAALILRLALRTRAAATPSRNAEAVALAIGAFASLLPVLAAPAQYSPRNGLYLLVCLLLAGMLVLVPQLQREPRIQAIGMGVLAVVALVGAFAGTHRLVQDDELASMRRAQQLARHASLHDPARRGTDVVLEPIRPYPPATLHAIDVTSD